MWTVTVAAIFLGITKTIPDPGYGEVLFQVCWVISVGVLRLLLGWRVALLLSAACGALYGLELCFLIKHTRFRPLADEISVGVVGGIVFGSALAGLAIVAGWLIHKLAQITIGARFPNSHNKTKGG
jgi:hypothetical protein